VACCFIAGLVRGFSGFALSALIMASLVVILPPIQLLPICFTMELLASTIMLRAGFRHADLRTVGLLILGSITGVPLGAYATTQLHVDTSRLIALGIIITFAVAQLFVTTPKIKTTNMVTLTSGFIAGVITGLASVGGMMIALYMLAQNLPPAVTRATLVLFLLAGSLTTGINYYVLDFFSPISLARSLVLAPVVAVGVVLGALLFNPSLQRYYRKFCLVLLIGIALTSLATRLLT